MTPVIAALAGVTGLSVGSFLNVVVYRVPRGLSVVRPASACPGCGADIRPRDNVPVVSWLALGGKCRECRMRISVRYPLLEAGTALVFVLVAIFFAPDIVEAQTFADALGAVLVLLAFLGLAAGGIALSAIDLELRRLPNPLVLFVLLVGMLLLPAVLLLGSPERFLSAVVGALASFLFYLVLAVISPRGMGMGDVKLAGVIGLYLGALGWEQLAVGVFAAFAVGAVTGVVALIRRRSLADRRIPFGPSMLVGAWIGIVLGEPLAAGYLRLVGLG